MRRDPHGAAPQVAGAVALLAQAFHNLSGAQIVNLLLSSARDAGDAGTDPVYGRGILDIGRAFAPQGSTALAGTSVAVPLADIAGAEMHPACRQTYLQLWQDYQRDQKLWPVDFRWQGCQISRAVG